MRPVNDIYNFKGINVIIIETNVYAKNINKTDCHCISENIVSRYVKPHSPNPNPTNIVIKETSPSQ